MVIALSDPTHCKNPLVVLIKSVEERLIKLNKIYIAIWLCDKVFPDEFAIEIFGAENRGN